MEYIGKLLSLTLTYLVSHISFYEHQMNEFEQN